MDWIQLAHDMDTTFGCIKDNNEHSGSKKYRNVMSRLSIDFSRRSPFHKERE
jgi:hypothetical protein